MIVNSIFWISSCSLYISLAIVASSSFFKPAFISIDKCFIRLYADFPNSSISIFVIICFTGGGVSITSSSSSSSVAAPAELEP